MVIELRVVQFWSEIILVISNQTRAACSFDFEITRMISDQIALHSVQLPLLIIVEIFFFSFLSYHQKYLLRQKPSLLRSLGLNSVELINSSVAARLNGYMGGYGSLKDFEAEVDDLKITDAQADMVRKIISSKRF